MVSIIITRVLSFSEKEELKKQSEKGDYQIFSIASEFNKFKNEQIIKSNINQQVGKECLDFISDFGHSSQYGKTVNEWLEFENRSYWYYLRFSSYFHYLPILKEQNIISEILDEHPNSDFIIYSKYEHQFDREITWKRNNSKPSKTAKKMKNLFLFCIIFITRAFIGFFQFVFIWNKKHALAIEPYVIEDIVDINDVNKRVKGDYYNEYLSKAMLAEQDFFFVSDFYLPKLSENLVLKKNYFFNAFTAKSINFEFYFLLKLFDPFLWISTASFRSNFDKFSKANQSEGNLLMKYVISKKNLLTMMHIREKVAASFFKIKKIKTLSCHHEQSYHHLSLINGAKKIGIPTIGFQHGTIHKEHIHYMFTEKDNNYDPTPDHMITWGEHWRQVLTEHSIYDETKTISLGQIRTDIITKLSNQKININPKIDLSKKTVLLASQTDQIGITRRRNIAMDFLRLSKSYSDLNFLIKPHPREADPYHYYESIAKEIGTTNFQITKDDLYLVLNVADVLITFHSTVASEAVYFKKPVLILNYENNDRDNYLKYAGAFEEIKSYEALNLAVDKISNDNYDVNEKVQDEFINYFSESINGKVSQSYINYIRTCTNSEKEEKK